MESTTLYPSLLPSDLPFPSTKSHPHKLRFAHAKRSSGMVVCATRRDDHSPEWRSYGELIVDESMIVLRKRIHEMKMIERNYEPPAEWMDWEKQHYASYNEFVCKFVGFLQLHLMDSRPSLALGMLLLITMSITVSMVMVAQQLMVAANGVFLTLYL